MVGEVLLLFIVKPKQSGIKMKEKLAFVRSTEYTEPVSKLEKVFGYVSLWWSISDRAVYYKTIK